MYEEQKFLDAKEQEYAKKEQEYKRMINDLREKCDPRKSYIIPLCIMENADNNELLEIQEKIKTEFGEYIIKNNQITLSEDNPNDKRILLRCGFPKTEGLKKVKEFSELTGISIEDITGLGTEEIERKLAKEMQENTSTDITKKTNIFTRIINNLQGLLKQKKIYKRPEKINGIGKINKYKNGRNDVLWDQEQKMPSRLDSIITEYKLNQRNAENYKKSKEERNNLRNDKLENMQNNIQEGINNNSRPVNEQTKKQVQGAKDAQTSGGEPEPNEEDR